MLLICSRFVISWAPSLHLLTTCTNQNAQEFQSSAQSLISRLSIFSTPPCLFWHFLNKLVDAVCLIVLLSRDHSPVFQLLRLVIRSVVFWSGLAPCRF